MKLRTSADSVRVPATRVVTPTDTARLLIRAALNLDTSLASNLDDLNIGHGVVIRILSHDRNTMGDA